jgi:hypothetical protein
MRHERLLQEVPADPRGGKGHKEAGRDLRLRRFDLAANGRIRDALETTTGFDVLRTQRVKAEEKRAEV